MREVVIVEAVRTATGRRGGALSSVHPIDLLGAVQGAALERAGVDPGAVELVVGGCVNQVGEQAVNPTRNAWLAAGLPEGVAGFTVDSQCGSAQQAATVAAQAIASGSADVVLACGVESMSRVPMGSTVPRDPDVGFPLHEGYQRRHELTTQFEAAERLAERWGLSREDLDRFGKLSQDRAAAAWDAGRYEAQVVPVEVPDPHGGPARVHARDEGLRETTLEGLARLTPTGRPDGLHTAGTSSQIADGASAVLLAERSAAAALGLRPLAQVVDTCLVGSNPTTMLEGPIPATRRILERNGLGMADLDLVEINEAFASVVLAWAVEVGADLDRVNPNGGAIAHGHPLGATGTTLLAKAAHELHRSGAGHALVTMCCAGGLGTGTLLRAIA